MDMSGLLRYALSPAISCMTGFQVVTGAFGYTGRYITQRLLQCGESVLTLTRRPNPSNLFEGQVRVAPFDFDQPAALAQSLAGATTLYNTYWVRNEQGDTTFAQAVRNSQMLIHAAEQAGVRRIVHISITNPSAGSPLPYFRGKALVEQAVQASALSYAIVRPTLIFGEGDILVNNIAWLLRRLPLFGIPGDGAYRLQPVAAEDVAEIAVRAGQRSENLMLDAAGPDVFHFDEFVRLIAAQVGGRALVVHMPVSLALACVRIIGLAVRDVMLSRYEAEGLMADLLLSKDAPAGSRRFADWLSANASEIGRHFATERRRPFRSVN